MKRYQVTLKESGYTIEIWGSVIAENALSAIEKCEVLASKTNYPNAREYIATEIKLIKN
jgi:hypothetical protein